MYDREMLAKRALAARRSSYSPYSHFCVGAALVCDGGKIYDGANIENASFGATNCAERTAFFKAIMEGERNFEAIAIVGAADGEEVSSFCPPCGMCRQVMAEFCSPEFEIVLYDGKNLKTLTLAELLPHSFDKDNL